MPASNHQKDALQIAQANAARIAHIDARLDSLSATVSDIAAGVRQLADRQAKGQETPWGVIAAWAGVMVTVGALSASGIAFYVSRVEAGVVDANRFSKETRALYDTHVRDGHPGRVEQQVHSNKEAIKGLDTTLQREMRLLDARQGAEVKALDERLQNEMRLFSEPNRIRIADLARRASAHETWQDQHDKRVVGLNAAQWERIYALERVVYQASPKIHASSGKGSR